MAQDEEHLTFSVEPLAKHHHRADFSCGIDALDNYLRLQASQDMKRGVAAPFVAVTPANDIVGYYTLSAFSIDLRVLPARQLRKLPKYPKIPATLLGRLAVDRNRHGLGLGEFLLVDALSRSNRATSDIASYAVVVDAKNEAAVTFYLKYDFIRFSDNPNRLFLPMKVLQKLFG